MNKPKSEKTKKTKQQMEKSKLKNGLYRYLGFIK